MCLMIVRQSMAVEDNTACSKIGGSWHFEMAHKASCYTFGAVSDWFGSNYKQEVQDCYKENGYEWKNFWKCHRSSTDNEDNDN